MYRVAQCALCVPECVGKCIKCTVCPSPTLPVCRNVREKALHVPRCIKLGGETDSAIR